MADDKDGKKLDRRSLLTGAAIGAGGVAALAAGGSKLGDMRRKFATPKAVAEGAAPEVELSFADSHPSYQAARRAPAGRAEHHYDHSRRCRVQRSRLLRQ
ncbi:MAG: hypothetical protein WDN04_07515 [Rhodospirillales bacterium]